MFATSLIRHNVYSSNHFLKNGDLISTFELTDEGITKTERSLGNLNELLMTGVISEVPFEIIVEQFCKPQYIKLFEEKPQNYKYYEFTNLSQLRNYATVGHSDRK